MALIIWPYSSVGRAPEEGRIVGSSPTKAIRCRTLYEFERSLLLDESIVDTSERRRALVPSTKGRSTAFHAVNTSSSLVGISSKVLKV